MKRLLIFLLVLSSFCQAQQRFYTGQQSALVRKNLLFTADGESGTLPVPMDQYIAADPAGVVSITKQTTIKRDGTTAYKFIVNKTDAEQQAGVRAELSQFSNALGSYPYDTWLGRSLYIDPSWTLETNPVLYYIMGQYHDDCFGQPTETEQKSPFEFCLAGSKFSFSQRWNDTETTGSVTEILANDNLVNMLPANPTISKGQWYSIVWHVRFEDPISTNPNRNNGRVEIWIDGVKVADYTGKIGYHHTKAPYLKIGNYSWMYNSGNLACCGNFTLGTTHIHYEDNIRFGNSSATYRDVAP